MQMIVLLLLLLLLLMTRMLLLLLLLMLLHMLQLLLLLLSPFFVMSLVPATTASFPSPANLNTRISPTCPGGGNDGVSSLVPPFLLLCHLLLPVGTQHGTLKYITREIWIREQTLFCTRKEDVRARAKCSFVSKSVKVTPWKERRVLR